VIYEYLLSTFQDGAINSDRLLEEIKATPALVDVEYVIQRGSVVDVAYPTALSNGDKAQLDAVIAAHRDAAHWLPDVKRAKFKAIDEKTNELIAGGFVYQGKTFELYLEAQVRLIGMLVLKDMLTYPIAYNSKDDFDFVNLTSPTDILTMAGTALSYIGAYLNGGTALKQAVRAATTIAEVDAIVDPR